MWTHEYNIMIFVFLFPHKMIVVACWSEMCGVYPLESYLLKPMACVS